MPTKKHAFLSASSAHRWLTCTASPHFEEQFPEPPVSKYAEEGTLAHEFCELYVNKYFNTPDWPSKKVHAKVKKLTAQPLYDPEMERTAQVYLDYLAEKAGRFQAEPYVAAEVKVDFSGYVPEGFGTCDCVMIGDRHLQITDYKHGKGVAVSAVNNPQMRLYALGALAQYSIIYSDIETVTMAICQPRITETPEEETITVEELLAWGESIRPLAQEAYKGPGQFVPGDHCRFCRGKAQCRARADHFTALEDFKDILPDKLSNEEIGDLLHRASGLLEWADSLRDYALNDILAGGEVPGWKVVEGRAGNRAFKDTDMAFQTLTDEGYEEAMLYERKPKTLAQLEAFLGKARFEELLGSQVVRPRGKPALVVESDKRAPYEQASAETDFAGVV